MIALLSNKWLGMPDITSPTPAIGRFIEWMRRSPNLFNIRSGARSVADQAMLYSWGRVARNPDMDRTGDPGPNGLGVYATKTLLSNHMRRIDGAFAALDVECVPAARPALDAAAKSFGLETLAWDPGHYEDPTVSMEAKVAGGGGLVMLALGFLAFTLARK